MSSLCSDMTSDKIRFWEFEHLIHMTQNMKTPALFALYFLTASCSGQAYFDLFKLEGAYSWPQAYNQLPAEAGFSEWTADLTLPIILKNGGALLTGFNAERISLQATADSLDLRLHGLSLKLGFQQKHGARWSGTWFLLPRLAADGGSLGGRDFQFGALGLLNFQPRTPDEHFRFGLLVNSEFFGPFFVPLLGYYRKKSRLEVNVLLPSNAELGYYFSPDFRLSLKFAGGIRSYATGNNRAGYLVKINNEVGLAAYLRRGKVVGYAFAGRSLGRTFRMYDAGDQLALAVSLLKFGDDRRQLNEDFGDGMFVKAGVLVRLNKEAN